MIRARVPAILLLLAGCSPQLEPIHWQGVDIEALREAVEKPSGVVDRASVEELAGDVVHGADAYWSVSSYLHEIFLIAPDERPEPAWVMPRALGGTSVYLLVACPGEGDAPPFSAGSIRVDSPTLTAEVVSTFEVRGQLLLSFEDCQIGRHTFDGSSPVHRDRELGELAIAPELGVSFDGRMIELDRPILWDASGELHVLYELDAGDTLVLEWSKPERVLRLRGANGSLGCIITPAARLDCSFP